MPAVGVAIPSAIQNIPSLLQDIWEGILKAVPKKKTSHMKKRHRQMAGKALKDVTSLNKCPACGRTKKMHTLCPTCMGRKLIPPIPSGILVLFDFSLLTTSRAQTSKERSTGT